MHHGLLCFVLALPDTVNHLYTFPLSSFFFPEDLQSNSPGKGCAPPACSPLSLPCCRRHHICRMPHDLLHLVAGIANFLLVYPGRCAAIRRAMMLVKIWLKPGRTMAGLSTRLMRPCRYECTVHPSKPASNTPQPLSVLPQDLGAAW